MGLSSEVVPVEIPTAYLGSYLSTEVEDLEDPPEEAPPVEIKVEPEELDMSDDEIMDLGGPPDADAEEEGLGEEGFSADEQE